MLYSKSFFSRIIIGLLFFSQGYGTINVHGQSMPIATPSKDKNYIISHTPRQGEDSINEISHKKRGTQITYFDGLGRKMQQIGFLQSPDEKILYNLLYMMNWAEKVNNFCLMYLSNLSLQWLFNKTGSKTNSSFIIIFMEMKAILPFPGPIMTTRH